MIHHQNQMVVGNGSQVNPLIQILTTTGLLINRVIPLVMKFMVICGLVVHFQMASGMIGIIMLREKEKEKVYFLF